MLKTLLVKYGVQPSEVPRLTMTVINVLLEKDDDGVVTLADSAALHRFMASGSNG